MNDPGKAIQERLERFRSGKPSETTVKKRKVSRLILFFNVILIVILLFVARRPGDQGYFSTGIEYAGLKYRFSVTRAEKTRDCLFSLTVESAAAAAGEYLYTGPVAVIAVLSDGKTVTRAALGDGITRISLRPGELKNFVAVVTRPEFLAFARNNPEAIVPKEKSFLSMEKRRLPLEARITINTKETLSLPLHFTYEVE